MKQSYKHLFIYINRFHTILNIKRTVSQDYRKWTTLMLVYLKINTRPSKWKMCR